MQAQMELEKQFQSTLPYGSDDELAAKYPQQADISIHAPLRERHLFDTLLYRLAYFNPRSLTGATDVDDGGLLHELAFQSTLPYGSDLSFKRLLNCLKNFNPRSLTGATQQETYYYNDYFKFQSTLPYGSDGG